MEPTRLLLSCVICLILNGYGNAQGGQDDTPYARITPSRQTVSEGSHVVFTCVSNLPEATFVWKKPVRKLDEDRDHVTMTQLSPNMSVLVIARTHVKRHKRTFRCEATAAGKTVSNDARLKVISQSRLHRNYPWITAYRQSDKYMFKNYDRENGVIVASEIECMTSYDTVAEASNRPLSWRWIRNFNSDIEFTEDYKSDRIQVTGEGHLLINNPRQSDYESPYICVAENSWGTAYSQPYMLNKTEAPDVPQPAPLVTCTDRKGREVEHGKLFQPDRDDPCIQCECFYGNRGTCMSVACAAPTCEFFEMSKEKCCEYTCIGDDIREKPNVKCTSFNGDTVDEGEEYHPQADPCVSCRCGPAGPVQCASASCIPPRMSCADMKPVPGKCCEFTCDNVPAQPLTPVKCTSFNGDTVDEGEEYHPKADPCVTCRCGPAGPVQCASASCIPPRMNCTEMKPVSGKCCEFTCGDVPTQPEPIIESPMQKVLGHVYVQQVGARKAIVQWRLPSSYDETMDSLNTFSVNVFRDLSDLGDARVIIVTGRTYVILDDIDPNASYYVMVNGTSEMKTAVLMSRTATFALKPRSSAGLVLSESLGQVYESRGAIRYTGYSLPRQFSPVNRQGGPDVIIQPGSFHRAEVSTYNESPCPTQDCGLLRFYSYDMEGELINNVSFLFLDARFLLYGSWS